MARQQEQPETIVASGMRIEGELKSNGNIRIDGVVAGKIQTAHDIMVGGTAQIDADINAENAVVAGVVAGNITVKGSILIMETGKVAGNISCANLGIREGAIFSGNCKMSEQKQVDLQSEEEQE
ncbi:MAG: polymer-forming cytoskeletal protein [Candidatus Doudnabacteria bacterium]|nr:polymer-forming cytoskeletal protein [Candidatus Doudnabacteria bacterium]